MKNKIITAVDKLDEIISIFALTGIIIVVSANVFFRFILNAPIPWAEEISLGLFVWLTFVGASVVMKTNDHISVDYFVRKLPVRFFILSQKLRIGLLFFITLVVFIIWGLTLALQSTWSITPVLGINYLWVYLAAPVGGTLCLWHLVKIGMDKNHTVLLKEEVE